MNAVVVTAALVGVVIRIAIIIIKIAIIGRLIMKPHK